MMESYRFIELVEKEKGFEFYQVRFPEPGGRHSVFERSVSEA